MLYLSSFCHSTNKQVFKVTIKLCLTTVLSFSILQLNRIRFTNKFKRFDEKAINDLK